MMYKSAITMPWYVYDAGATDVTDPNNYGPPLSTPPSCPSPKIYLCAIQAADNSGSPVILIVLQAEIANALNNKAESTNVKLRPTR